MNTAYGCLSAVTHPPPAAGWRMGTAYAVHRSRDTEAAPVVASGASRSGWWSSGSCGAVHRGRGGGIVAVVVFVMWKRNAIARVPAHVTKTARPVGPLSPSARASHAAPTRPDKTKRAIRRRSPCCRACDTTPRQFKRALWKRERRPRVTSSGIGRHGGAPASRFSSQYFSRQRPPEWSRAVPPSAE